MSTLLYRSPATRWVLTATGIWAGSLILFGGDRWRDTPSLHWLAHAQIPLRWWGAALIVYALMLTFERTRARGFAVGAGLYGLFAISLIATIPIAGPKSAAAIAGLVDLSVLHVYAMKTALADAEMRRG